MTEQDLQLIRLLMREELAPISERLDGVEGRLSGIEGRLDRLEEGQEELRSCMNALLEWADKVGSAYQFPLPQL